MSQVEISSIVVNRDERQRRELEGIDELAWSIGTVGLINAIVIDENNVLIAGERRLTACKALGWTHIEATRLSDLSEYDRGLVELEENIRRVDLSWQDRALATARLHAMLVEHNPGWTQQKTSDKLGQTQQHVARNIMVAESIMAGNDRVKDADKLSVAVGIVERESSRKKASGLAAIDAALPAAVVAEEEPSTPSVPLLHADFAEWWPTYTGPKFNMIHCDFPYGVGMHKSDQGAGSAFGTYADDEDVYWHLLNELACAMDTVVAPSAHLIFWYSMDYHHRTIMELTLMGWKVNPFPLIWMKSDNTGILPDAKRGPRRIYETALFASRGDRLLATGPHGQGAVANCFAAPGSDKTLHMNEKPVAMIRHFMRLCVDEYSNVLDPTAGSANAIRAAIGLGAGGALGIERDRDFYEAAAAAFHSPSDN